MPTIFLGLFNALWYNLTMTDFSGTVYGSLVSKANSRRITRSGLVIKSKAAIDFTNSAIIQLQALRKGRSPIESNVGMDITIYYSSRRPDLSPELFFDCLEKAGVLANDRQIFQYTATKMLDKDNPRVEFSIYSFE